MPSWPGGGGLQSSRRRARPPPREQLERAQGATSAHGQGPSPTQGKESFGRRGTELQGVPAGLVGDRRTAGLVCVCGGVADAHDWPASLVAPPPRVQVESKPDPLSPGGGLWGAELVLALPWDGGLRVAGRA